MEIGFGNTLLPGDPRLVDHIVGEVKSQGIFDQFRKECIADVDTKPAYQNLRTRVESSVNSFLSKQKWKPDLNKNQLRETLRKQMFDASYLDAGVERIVDQVVNPKIYSIFMPQVEDVVYKFLGLEKPKREKNGSCGFKDLLPIDLDPVSPESDKNSLKDISLDSVDANIDGQIEVADKAPLNFKRNDIHDNGRMNVDNDANDRRFDVENDKSPGPSVRIGSFTPPLPRLNDIVKLEGKSKEENENENEQEEKKADIEEKEGEDDEEEDEEDEEEEEESPVFEPIDAINLHESNISNDSHLSGISELTSHRSRSPVFINDFSRDNMDFSNQDSQLSKVSSDSRLSIVTDFGSSNQASTPVSENLKDDNSREKFAKDNFKAIRDETSQDKDDKIPVEIREPKEYTTDMKDGNDTNSSKNLSSKESSRDATDNGSKDHKPEQKEKHKSRERSKSSKERSDSKESRNHKDREKDSKRKHTHSDSKIDSSDKSKSRDKLENSNDKSKDSSMKSKDEKPKELTGKESKDLKDIYKEKIRELREKKELTEKEKLNKNRETKDVNKESKTTRESRDKRDSSRDKKEHRSSTSSRNHSSSRHDSKSSSKSSSKDDPKNSKSENKDKSKRDERRHSTSKDSKSRQSTESAEKSDIRRSSKSEKDEKSDGKKEVKSSKKDSRSESHVKSSEKSDSRREKSDSESKDKKRRDDKKSKTKDDHSSLRKNSTDRRSSDRDGSNGSNGKNSHKSNSSPSTSSTKPASSSLSKESSNAGNSSSETSDSIEEPQVEKSRSNECDVTDDITMDTKCEIDENSMRIELGQNEISLPLKKRPLTGEENPPSTDKIIIKKPKFARNFQEAKKLMKIRKKMEREEKERARKSQSPVENVVETNEIVKSVPDEERVQIIEVRDEDEDEDEPYPENQCNFTLDGQSKIILEGNEVLHTRSVVKQFNRKSNLSEMELSIRQSLAEMISDSNMLESGSKNSEIASSSGISAEDDQSIEQQRVESEDIIEEIQKDLALSARDRSSDKPEKSSRSQLKQSQSSTVCKQPDRSDLQKILETSGSSLESSDEPSSFDISDEEDCLYFIEDNRRLNRFTKFMKSLKVFDESMNANQSDKMLNREIETSETNTMAPPQSKRKYSTSPLSDILMNNSNNNNNALKTEASGDDEDGAGAAKKKRMARPRRQRSSLSSQGSINGENFVMPLSPESDVSATSEKTLSSTSSLKDEKNRPRGSSQRYTSDDLYKPRPLFASSSRRSRRSNQI